MNQTRHFLLTVEHPNGFLSWEGENSGLQCQIVLRGLAAERSQNFSPDPPLRRFMLRVRKVPPLAIQRVSLTTVLGRKNLELLPKSFGQDLNL